MRETDIADFRFAIALNSLLGIASEPRFADDGLLDASEPGKRERTVARTGDSGDAVCWMSVLGCVSRTRCSFSTTRCRKTLDRMIAIWLSIIEMSRLTSARIASFPGAFSLGRSSRTSLVAVYSGVW